MNTSGTINRTKKDSQGRVWDYCDGDGSWSHGQHCIGCGARNVAKWSIWGGPQSSNYEHKTLGEAVAACYKLRYLNNTTTPPTLTDEIETLDNCGL